MWHIGYGFVEEEILLQRVHNDDNSDKTVMMMIMTISIMTMMVIILIVMVMAILVLIIGILQRFRQK